MHTHLPCLLHMLQCSGELAAEVIGYLYTGHIEADASTAAGIISLANLWQLPGTTLLQDVPLLTGLCQTSLSCSHFPFSGRLCAFAFPQRLQMQGLFPLCLQQ